METERDEHKRERTAWEHKMNQLNKQYDTTHSEYIHQQQTTTTKHEQLRLANATITELRTQVDTLTDQLRMKESEWKRNMERECEHVRHDMEINKLQPITQKWNGAVLRGQEQVRHKEQTFGTGARCCDIHRGCRYCTCNHPSLVCGVCCS